MAVSSSQSTGKSSSSSDTYIPEYSESPILREIALHARAMSDVVYQWGMNTYNKNQGNIDNLMRDALSYASPQRIAVDMGMAEAGVMQAGERGRLSAIRDLESYGIDPSSGRYAALDSANRVMTAAAAAGAGNQQRMASEAAGNAMRNQAISASLQNANFGVAAGESANRYLQTASSLKYPPLGRWSESTSEQQSTSNSSSESGGGGSKQQQPKEEKQPQEKGGGGGGQPRQASDRAGREGKSEPGIDTPPGGRRQSGTLPPLDINSGAQSFDEEGFIDRYPGSDVFDSEQELPPAEEPWMDPNAGIPESIPPDDPFNDPNAGIPPGDELTAPDEAGFQPPQDDLAPDEAGFQPPSDGVANYPGSDVFDTEQEMPAYDPYAGQTLVDNSAFNPVTGQSTGEYGDEQQIAEADPAGAVYGLGDGGDWTSDIIPAGYTAPEFGGDETWSDIGQGMTYDSTYDTAVAEAPGYDDEVGYTDDWTGDIGDDAYGDLGDYGDWGDWGDQDYYGDEGEWGEYDDPYADWGEEDYYGDEGDYEDEYDWGGEDEYDWGDEDDIDYGEDYDDPYEDEEFDYEEAGGEDEGGDDYEYEGEGGGEEYEYEDAGGDYGGEYASGGPVGRQKMPMRARAPGGQPPRRPRPMTGYRQQPGAMPGARRMDPPPAPPPGVRPSRPQQAPRPQRGAPMAAPGGPRPTPMIGRGPQMPGNFISANGMPPPTTGGMQRPQRMARGGSAGRRPEPTTGGFVSRSLSPSGGSTTDDVDARLNAGEFVIPKDVATWKGKEFFYKMIASARKNRSAPNGGQDKPQTGYSGASGMPGGM